MNKSIQTHSKEKNDFAKIWPEMYNPKTREQKAKRIIKTLQHFFKQDKFKSCNVLDVGCSTGIIDNYLANYFNTITGLDSDKNAVLFAKKTFIHHNLNFRVGDALNLPFTNESFDIVICTHIYEHVPNAKKMFDEIYRVLKPGGICYLAAINKFWPIEPHYFLPFLSFLPQNIADFYVRLMRKNNIYDVQSKSFWEIKKITSKFNFIDYTEKIISDPNNFAYENISLFKPHFKYIKKIFLPCFKIFSPTFFCLLVKDKPKV